MHSGFTEYSVHIFASDEKNEWLKTDCYDCAVNFSIAEPTELAKQQCDYHVRQKKEHLKVLATAK